jgi:hypothetical protein
MTLRPIESHWEHPTPIGIPSGSCLRNTPEIRRDKLMVRSDHQFVAVIGFWVVGFWAVGFGLSVIELSF